MAAFKTEIDVVNRALQHLRVRRIRAFTDQSFAAQEMAFTYPRVREAELKEHLWRFSTRREVLYPLGPSSYLWTPPTYNASTTYGVGAIVVDSAGDWWQTKVAGVVGTTPAQGSSWQHYFGPDSCTPFFTSSISAPATPTLTSTAGGSLVALPYYVRVSYVGPNGESVASGEANLSVPANALLKVTSPAAATGADHYNVYVGNTAGTEMLQNASPITLGTDWTEPTTGLVFGIRPITAYPTIGVTPNTGQGYYIGDLTSYNGAVYRSLINNNTDVPATVNWQLVSGTVVASEPLYPIGTGPVTDTKTLNVFRLPHGYLRQAPTDPKAGASTWLGAPHTHVREDYVFEGNYLVSATAYPLMLRYVADFVDVPDMDASFCEMLAARCAIEVGPLIIDNERLLPTLIGNARGHYEREREAATAVNAIEIGSIDLERDDYITARY